MQILRAMKSIEIKRLEEIISELNKSIEYYDDLF